MKKKIKILVLGFFYALILASCAKIDPVTNERVNYEINPDKRAEDARNKSGGIFGSINNSKNTNTFDFATSNVLWRATLKSLDFLPLMNADYSGGLIVYDWYSTNSSPNEQIKITVQFLNNELRAESIKVLANKKICDSNQRCLNSSVDQKFIDNIKDSIISSARILKIEEAKKEKK